jgi:hypothetical protein
VEDQSDGTRNFGYNPRKRLTFSLIATQASLPKQGGVDLRWYAFAALTNSVILQTMTF